MYLLGLRYATETTLGSPACLLPGKTLLDVLLCRFGQMARDLVVDLAIHLPGTTEGPQPTQKDPQACHEGFSEVTILPRVPQRTSLLSGVMCWEPTPRRCWQSTGF